MRYAIVEDGVVTNVVILYPGSEDVFPHAVPCERFAVEIGDTWDGTAFCREGEKVPGFQELELERMRDMQAALEVLGVTVNG